MEVPKSFRAAVASRAETVLRDKLRQTELEARVTRPIDKTSFTRLLRYCRGAFGVHRPAEDTLDISQDRGPYRATVVDAAGVGRLCMSEVQSDIGEDAVIIQKGLLAPRLDLAEHGLAVSLKQEEPAEDRDAAVKALFSGSRVRSYRLKRRFSFFSPDDLFSVDLTVVKQKVGARVDALYGAREKFEVEIELLPPADADAGAAGAAAVRARAQELADALLRLCAEVLLVMNGQREGALLRASDRNRIMSGYLKLVALPETVANRFVGPQPVTLERANLASQDGGFDILRGYTVTEKADGRRALLYIDDSGRGFLLDMTLVPTETDILVPEARSSLLDGELITRTIAGTPIMRFMVFDAYFVCGQDKRSLPLTRVGEGGVVGGGAPARETRLAAALEVAAALGACVRPSVAVKRFYAREDAPKVLREAERGAFEYAIDGLIFTPADLGVFQNHAGAAIGKRTGTWGRVFKWKPASENSVDFKVVYDKTSRGDLVLAGNRLHARLLVGRQGVASGGLIDAYSILVGTYNASAYELLEFTAPDYGLGDARAFLPEAGAAGARELPRCVQPPFETVEDESIVEFSWDAARSTWVPMRVRHDKIKPNAHKTALGVWRSIAYPVAIGDIADPSRVESVGPSESDEVYFARDTARDGSASQAMRRFHGFWIKNRTLLAGAAAAARDASGKLSLFDIAVGEGGDLRWWMDNRYDVVVGVDNVEANVLGSERGAYARLSEAIQSTRDRRGRRYAFAQMTADAPVGAEAVAAIRDPGLRAIAENLWSVPETRADPKLRDYYGLADRKFDVVSIQFAVHYFFDTAARLDALLDNIERYLRPGGVLIGTCLDGASVDAAFRAAGAEGGVLQGEDKEGNIVWRVQKRYEGELASGGSEENLGKQVDVYLETINKTTPEFLVDFELLHRKLGERGIVPLDAARLEAFGATASSELFGDTFYSMDWARLAASGEGRLAHNARLAGAMDETVRRYSFLNRWFAFAREE